jgi:hypothetical protein
MGPFDGDFWSFVSFFWSFLLVNRVVGFFWCFLLGQMGIFGVGIFIDRGRGYSRRPSPDLNDELDENPARISPDTPAVSPDLDGSRQIHRPFLQISPDRRIRLPFLSIPYTILEKEKKNEEEKNRSISVLF